MQVNSVATYVGVAHVRAPVVADTSVPHVLMLSRELSR